MLPTAEAPKLAQGSLGVKPPPNESPYLFKNPIILCVPHGLSGWQNVEIPTSEKPASACSCASACAGRKATACEENSRPLLVRTHRVVVLSSHVILAPRALNDGKKLKKPPH